MKAILTLTSIGLSLVLGAIGPTARAEDPSPVEPASSTAEPPKAQAKQPNILVIWGDDIGIWNISFNSKGMMGYTTPNIDRIANEGIAFTDYYGQQSCTAGRAAFISGSVPVRTGMTKVGNRPT